MPICLVALLALNFQGTNARPNFPITGDLEQAAEATKRAWQQRREVDGRTAAAAPPVVLVLAKCEGESKQRRGQGREPAGQAAGSSLPNTHTGGLSQRARKKAPKSVTKRADACIVRGEPPT